MGFYLNKNNFTIFKMSCYLSLLIFLPIVTSLKCYEGIEWAESEEKPELKECDVYDVCLFGNATLNKYDHVMGENVISELPMVGKCVTLDTCDKFAQLDLLDIASEVNEQFQLLSQFGDLSVKKQHFQCCFNNMCNAPINIETAEVEITTLQPEEVATTSESDKGVTSESELEVTTGSNAVCTPNNIFFVAFNLILLMFFA